MEQKEYYQAVLPEHSYHVALVPEGQKIKVIKVNANSFYSSVHIEYIDNLPAKYFRFQQLDKSSRVSFTNAWNAALGIQKERQLFLL